MSQQSTSTPQGLHTGWDRHAGGIRWRIIASILVPVAWISFTLLYVGFWASGFTLFQSIIIILVSLLVLAGVMGVVWVSAGPGYRHYWD